MAYQVDPMQWGLLSIFWKIDMVLSLKPEAQLMHARPTGRAPITYTCGFFIYIFFKNVFYRNIFLVSHFIVLYPYRPAGGQQGPICK